MEPPAADENPSMLPPFHACHQSVWEWPSSRLSPRDTGCRGTAIPSLMPVCTVSAPGNPLKRLSKLRFSCMMMTTCSMGDPVTGVTVLAGTGGDEKVTSEAWQPTSQTSPDRAIAPPVKGTARRHEKDGLAR